MAFQFQCPTGHVLEGDESQAGQAIPCPVCQVLFLIPAPISEPKPATPQFQSGPEFQASASAFSAPAEPAQPELLHIACPKGHVLEVPPDMLDTEVLCPQCGEQFGLRARDSIEHRKKREREAELREEKSNQFWLKFAITVATLVILMLLTMAIMTAMGPSRPVPPAKKPEPAPTPPVVTQPETPPIEEMNPSASKSE